MAEFKHLVLVKFKEDAKVEEILKGMEKLVSEMDTVKSFEWGQDIESQEMLRQGFTHAFLMTFKSKDDFTAFASHPNHVDFSTSFSTAIEKAVLLDFPTVSVKSHSCGLFAPSSHEQESAKGPSSYLIVKDVSKLDTVCVAYQLGTKISSDIPDHVLDPYDESVASD